MSPTPGRLMAVMLIAAGLLYLPATTLTQNQSPPRPQAPEQPAGNKSPAAPAEPPPPATAPLYISPAVVQHIQQKLLAMGYAVPTVSGAWGDNSAAALAKFQASKTIDPGGDLDELTLVALQLPQVLVGEAPADLQPVSTQAVASHGAPLSASPRLVRVVQSKLTEAGFATDNVFGIWIAGSETAARAFQKAKNLDPTGALDLRLIHALGLTKALLEPSLSAKLPSDNVAAILSEKAVPLTGAPLSLSPTGIRQVQAALQKRGHKDVAVDGKWTEQASSAMKRFQEAQGLEPTGSFNLRTLRALGFTQPLGELDQTPIPTTRSP